MISIITNRKQILYTDLVTHLKKCVHPSVDRIILREKDLEEAVIKKKIDQIKTCPDLKTLPLMLNGPYPLEETYGADGRHYTMDQYRQVCESGLSLPFKVGVSIHSLEEISYINKYPVDYILYGHIFPTACKAGLQQRGLDNLKILMEHASVPLIALGGITEDNYKRLFEKDCYHFAMMSSVMQSENPCKYLNLFSCQ